MRIYSCIALLALSSGKVAAFGSSPTKFDRKCPFSTPKDNIKFTNKVSLPKRTYYRCMQFVQRKFAEKGGPYSKNPLVRIIGAPFYWIDAFYGGVINTNVSYKVNLKFEFDFEAS
jgi:hypothetical protein